MEGSMRIFNKKDIIKIDEQDLKDAGLSSADFSNEQKRKRAFANVLAARLGMKFLFSQKLEANNLFSMYSIQKILENLDISDVNLSEIRIDVRLVFNHEEIFIPKTHFQYDIQPDLYLILQLGQDMKEAQCLGFFEPFNVNKENQNEDYFFFEYEKLQKPEELKKFLSNFVPEPRKTSSPTEIEEAEDLILGLIDDEITEVEREFLYNQLYKNASLREKFVEFENFELISRQAGKNNAVSNDEMLDFVGAQKVFDENFDEDTIEEINFLNDDEMDAFLADSDEKEEKIEIDFDEMFNDEDNQSDENKTNKDDSGLPEGIIQGAAIAGTAALAGAAGAGLAATFAQSMAAASAQGVIEGAASVAATAIEAVANTVESPSFEELKAEEAQKIIDLEEATPAFEIDEEEFFENLEEVEMQELSENQENIAEEETDAQTDEKTEEIFEDGNEISAEENQEETETYTLEEIQGLEELAPLDSLETPLEMEEIPDEEINAFAESDEEFILPEEIESLEPEPIEQTDDNVIDLADFDFETFNDESEANESQSEEGQNAEISNKNDEEIQIEEDLNLLDFEEITEDSTPASDIKNDEEIFSFDELDSAENQNHSPEELEEIDFDETTEDEDVDKLAFEIDDFLNHMELTDEQKAALSTEINVSDLPETNFSTENDEQSYENPYSDKVSELSYSKLTAPETNYYNSQTTAQEPPVQSGFNALPAEVLTDEEDSDLLKVLFKEDSAQNPEELDIGVDTEESLTHPATFDNKKKIIAASVAGVIFISLVAGGIGLSNKNKEVDFPKSMQTSAQGNDMNSPNPAVGELPAQQDLNEESTMDLADQMPATSASAQNMQAQPGRDMGQAVSEAFMSDPISANVSKVAWEVPEEYAYNDAFRKYLQTAGKNIKLTLQNDLLTASEMAYSDKIVMELEIGKTGGVKAANIAVSSGSKQIDKIVLQSVKETLGYLKLPSGEVNGQSVNATLIINF